MTVHKKQDKPRPDHRNQSDRRHGFEMRVEERRKIPSEKAVVWPYLEKRKPDSDRRRQDDRRLGGGRRVDDWWMEPGDGI